MQQQQAVMLEQGTRTLASVLRTEACLGHLFEADVRVSVATKFGAAYAEPALVGSLFDAARLLPLDLEAAARAAERASHALVDIGTSRELLLRCERAASQRAEKRGSEAAARCEVAGPWLAADGSVQVAAMETCLKASGDVALATLARKLRKSVGLPPEEQAAFLLSRGGPGVACLLAASFPTSSDDLPGESFQLDASGRLEFWEGGAVLMADVGEIKSGMDYATAVPQLGRALDALRWMATTCCGCDAARALLVGRLFVPRSQVDVVTADAQQVELASSQYGFQLHVHAL